jgi:hypothetical protein
MRIAAHTEYTGTPGAAEVRLSTPRGETRARSSKGTSAMALILLVLLLALLLAGVGFAIHVLWWIALVVIVLWLLGFLVRVGEGSSRSRWYRW